MKYLTDRLSEMSTWRGLIALGTALGVKLAPNQQEAIVATGLAIIGLINVFRVERK
jgi:hypothetical protein